MSWWSLLPLAATALAWVLLPGGLIGWLGGLRGIRLAYLAPALSIATIALAAILAGWIGLPWGPAPVIALTGVLGLVLWGIECLRRRFSPTQSDEGQADADDGPPTGRTSLVQGSGNAPATTALSANDGSDMPGSKDQAPATAADSRPAWFWLGWAIAGVIMTWQTVTMLGQPNWFSQTYDNAFHLSATRWALDFADASSFHIGRVVSGDLSSGFYPAAWHGLATLVATTIGSTDVVLATNATIWVACAVIWPVGALGLVRAVLPRLTPAGQIGAAILTTAFPAFPSLLAGFGVLYPNLIGLALLPAVLAWTLEILGLSPRDKTAWPGRWLLLGGAFIGLSLAHPNASLSYLALLVAPGLVWAWRQFKQRPGRWPWVAGVLTLALAMAALAWIKLRPPLWSAIWGPIEDPVTALGQLLKSGSISTGGSWLLALLLAGGLACCLMGGRRRRLIRLDGTENWWLLGCFAMAGLLWLVAAVCPSGWLRYGIVGVYYSDPYRLAALLPIVTLPLTVLGLEALLRLAAHWLGGLIRQPRPFLIPLVGGVAGAALLLGTNWLGPIRPELAWVRDHYAISEHSPLVTSDEYALILRLPDLVPAGVRVVTDPWNGGSLAYGITGVLTTTTHLAYSPTAGQLIIEASLDDAALIPDVVCPVVRELDLGFVLDFGPDELWGDNHPMPGLDDLATADGFTAVAQVGPAVLYRIDACH